MNKKLSLQFSWILLGRVLAAGLQATILAVLARALGPQQFGVLAAILGVIILLQAASDLGMGKLIVRERSAGDSEDLLAGGLWVNSISSTILGLILALVFVGAALTIDKSFFLMLPLAISAAGEKNADAWLGVAIADGDTHLNSINLVGRRALSLIIFMGLSHFEVSPLLSYSIAVAISALASVMFARQHVSKIVLSKEISIKLTLLAARPYWVNTLAVQFRNLDSAIVGIVASPAAAGFYATAAKLSSPLRMLPTSLAVVILPHAARTRNESAGSLAKIAFASGSIVGVLYILIALLVPWALPLLLGDSYLPAVTPLQIVLIGLVFASFSSLFEAALQGRGYPRMVAISSVLTTLYLLTTMVTFTTISGAIGSAVALATSYAFESIVLGGCFTLKALRKE